VGVELESPLWLLALPVLAAVLVLAGGAAAFGALRRAHHESQREPSREDLVLAG